MAEYLVPGKASETEHTEKRSRFIACVQPVETEEAARDFIAAKKKEHYAARHNCWCYIIKDGPERYSDDGEPQGTAGQPMLEVFRREGVSNFVCVVTRYFGGVLLGAGGLLRAYTKSARDALDTSGVSVMRRWISAEFCCPYPMAERLKAVAESIGAVCAGTDYGVEVCFNFLVPEAEYEAFAAAVFDSSRGSVSPTETGECFRAASLK